jgi:hypothetical protein
LGRAFLLLESGKIDFREIFGNFGFFTKEFSKKPKNTIFAYKGRNVLKSFLGAYERNIRIPNRGIFLKLFFREIWAISNSRYFQKKIFFRFSSRKKKLFSGASRYRSGDLRFGFRVVNNPYSCNYEVQEHSEKTDKKVWLGPLK